jgi:hypothetical protein
MPVAITFDPNFTYDQPDPLNNKNSVKHLNDQGVEQGTCVHCGNCDFGCQVHAKNPLDLNYIPQAEKYNAEVRPLHYVRFIEPVDGGYRATFDRIIPLRTALPTREFAFVELQGADYSTGLDSIWLMQPQHSCAKSTVSALG